MRKVRIFYFTKNYNKVAEINELMLKEKIKFIIFNESNPNLLSKSLNRKNIDILIADFELILINKLDFHRIFKNNLNSKQMPCIILAEDNNVENFKYCIKKGASDYLNAFEIYKLPFIVKKIIGDIKSKNSLEFDENNFKKLSEFNKLGVLIYQNYTWVYTNKYGEEISEYSAEELYKMKIWDGIHPSFKKFLFERAKKRIKGEIVFPKNFELKIKTKSGKEKWVSLTGKLIRYNSKPAGLIFVNDISKHKTIEENYKNIIESAPIGFYKSSIDGKILLYNKEFTYILGIENSNDLNGKNIKDFYYEDDEREKLIKKYDVNQNSKVRNIEIKFKRRDGNTIWILMTVNAIKNEKLETIYYDGFIIDITERKKTESNLQKTLSRNKALLDAIPDLIFVFSQEGVFLDYNVKDEKNLYISPSEFMNKKISDVFPEKIAKLTLKKMNLLFETKKPVIFEYEINIDGKINYYESRMVLSEENLVFSLVRDITEKKLMEINIQEKELVFSKLFYESADPILLFYENRFIDCNNSTVKLFGYQAKDEFIPFTPTVMLPLYQPNGKLTIEFVKEMIQITNKNGFHKFEMDYINKKGKDFVLEIMLTLIKVDGKPMFHVLLRDISEKRKAEIELLKAKETAEESNKLKDAFISNMSHEIRTPLNGIIGMTNILKESFEEYITEEEDKIFKIIDFSSNRLIRTIDMILSVSRLQIGEHPIYPTTNNLNELLDNLVKEYQVQAKSKSINLFNINTLGEINILFDKYCITQSISNLIDNAIKYTNNGYVKVFTTYDSDKNLLINIEDSGIGISEDFKKQIFHPYSQEETGYSRSYEGVGLGLSLVKKLLELNGANISVNSKKGKGSCFSVKIDSKNIIHKNSNVLSYE